MQLDVDYVFGRNVYLFIFVKNILLFDGLSAGFYCRFWNTVRKKRFKKTKIKFLHELFRSLKIMLINTSLFVSINRLRVNFKCAFIY